jgi:hypothetical protein
MIKKIRGSSAATQSVLLHINNQAVARAPLDKYLLTYTCGVSISVDVLLLFHDGTSA